MTVVSWAPMGLKGEKSIVAERFVTLAATAALLLALAPVQAAGEALQLKEIPGSTIKRVILSDKAAERLGLALAEVEEKPMVLKQMIGGEVLHKVHVKIAQKKARRNAFGGFARVSVKAMPKPKTVSATGPLPGEAWIRLVMSDEEWSRVAKNKAARVFPLATRGELKKKLMAKISKLPPSADRKRTMSTIYYVVDGQNNKLKAKDRVRVELPLKGNNTKRKVVPYSSVYYDGQGTPWVYTIVGPLTFERKRIDVERIIGDEAYLKAGPSVGTPVVSVGASLLYGAEVIYKK
jgi:hypothetical protein